MDNITASEVAGLGVGAVLLYATLAATKVDAFFSSSQRRFSISISLYVLCEVLFQELLHYMILGHCVEPFTNV